MSFGQLVIGPPGSGKSTYCNGMQQYLQLVGRKLAVINLDPANDHPPYECTIDIADLVSLEAVMTSLHLGPNGGVLQSQPQSNAYAHSYIQGGVALQECLSRRSAVLHGVP